MIVHRKESAIPPVLLSARDAARSLAVSERTLSRLTKRGEIACVRLNGGRSLRYSVAAIERFVAQQEAAAAIEPPD